MEEHRTERLHLLLKRLGQAVHGAVVDSEEIQACLDELHHSGWDAVMLLEASLVCRDERVVESDEASLHVHVNPRPRRVAYRLDAEDAAILSSLGISPSRHRGRSSVAGSELDDEPRR